MDRQRRLRRRLRSRRPRRRLALPTRTGPVRPPCGSTPARFQVRRPMGWSGCPAAPSGWAAKAATCRMRLPAHLVALDGFWMDRTPVTNARVRAVRGGDRLRDRRRARARSRGTSPACRRTSSCPDPPCSRPRRRPCRSTIRCSGGATRQARAGGIRKAPAAASTRKPRPSGRARRLRGCRGVRRLGRQAAADGSGVRVRRARRPRSTPLPVGQRDDAGRQGGGEHLAGAVPGPRSGRGRLSFDVAGHGVRAQRLRPLRHGRQRLAVVLGLVSSRHLRDARETAGGHAGAARAGRQLRSRRNPAPPSVSCAAGRSSAPINTARAIWSAAAAKPRSPAGRRTWASAWCVPWIDADRRHRRRPGAPRLFRRLPVVGERVPPVVVHRGARVAGLTHPPIELGAKARLFRA